MEKAPQWILWFIVFMQHFLLGNAMQNGRKLTTSDSHPDFISIDCGASSGYTDRQTGISYQTDTGFVETGKSFMIATEERFDIDYPVFGRQLQTLRSFPEGKRNCYNLKPKQGKNQNYLIRAFFAYGNYDAKNQTTKFDLFLNVDLWKTVDLDYANDYDFAEIIHTPTTDTILVCLVNTDRGTPFISTLELRPLTNSIYLTPSPSQSLLVLDTRIDVGSIDFISDLYTRFEDDIYDRVWRADDVFDDEDEGLQKFNSSEHTEVGSISDSYKLPMHVFKSAIKSLNLSYALTLDYDTLWKEPPEKSYGYYFYFHFVEIEKLPAGQMRVIDITVNGENINPEPITLEYLKPVTVVNVTVQDGFNFSIRAAPKSDAPPILNAIETYKFISPLTPPTDQTDANAILVIKTTYEVNKVSWQGDPCVPQELAWEGLKCRYFNNNNNARIISLNLSASKLRGQIAASFSQLTELESLDLSNNDLSGSIPEFLAKLPELTILNLSGNKLTGSVPKALKENSNLEMSLEDNPNLCLRDPCKKHNKFLVPLIAAVSALTAVILISLGIWIFKMKKLKAISIKQEAPDLRNPVFSYSDVLEITNNFQNLIGEGGFGKVYVGTLKNCTQVAVKLLSHSSMQGHREFQSEVETLMVVHHRHLVSLIGYCEESDVRALIYEYMANGNLHHYLLSNKGGELKWKDRLQIALDAAYGLDYLHNGCKPAIIHRDLKASNILLDKNMEAKIADFGLSRAFANDIDSHVSTRPAGTFGYLDPEFQKSGNLTKGSDVYSFGIILLQLVTGKPAAKRQPDNSSSLLINWVSPKLDTKDIKSIVDPRLLKAQYGVDSAWKFLKIAMSCTAPQAIHRPDISQVVVDLRECLAMEIRIMEGTSHNTNSSSSLDMSANVQFDSSFSAPSAR